MQDELIERVAQTWRGEGFATLEPAEQDRARDHVRSVLRAVEDLGLRIEGRLARTGPAPEQADAESLLRAGEPLLAYDLLARELEERPSDVRLRQLTALALARCGATRRAREILQALHAEGHADEESLGLMARTAKDLALRATEGVQRERLLAEAQSLYGDAYRRTGGFWTGINAATMASLLHRQDEARGLAAEVRDLALADLAKRERSGEDAYWTVATLGEAALIRGDLAECEAWYARASRLGQSRLGDVSSTRRNARLLLEAGGHPVRLLDAWFRMPAVGVFAGHMVDRPDRPSPRFRPQDEEAVKAALRELVEELDLKVGFSAAACGGDLLFLEALLERGAEVHVVLPLLPEAFRPECVDFHPGWGERFDRVLARAKEVVVASDRREASQAHYVYAMELMHGLAAMRADQLETSLVGVALWDGRVGDGPGGTADFVARCQERGQRIEVVRPDGTRAPVPETVHAAALPEAESRPMAILFADAMGFSKLEDEQVPRFVRHFLGAVAEVAGRYGPRVKNTWGDGLYFLLDDVRSAGQFALDLQDRVNATSWEEVGLPKGLCLRVALHAGPLLRCDDPVTGQVNYTGRHVSRAARIEPVAPPGEVYASREFAALGASRGAEEFDAEYVGQMGLAKGYGVFPTYHVRRAIRD